MENLELRELTEKQAAFVREYVSNGGNATKAAQSAGYSAKAARITGYGLLKIPHVLAAVRLEQVQKLGGRLSTLALDTLEQLMTDKQVSGAVRLEAAKTVLDRAGMPSRAAPQAPGEGAPKALTDMTVDELDVFIQQGSAAISKMRDAQALPGEAARVDDVALIGAS